MKTMIKTKAVTKAVAVCLAVGAAIAPTQAAAATCAKALHTTAEGAPQLIRAMKLIMSQEHGSKDANKWDPFVVAYYKNEKNPQRIVYRAKSSADAVQKIKTLAKAGVTNIDIGCAQVNYKWHKQNFASIAQMVDPVQNVSYATLLVESCKSKNNDWYYCIKKYHSHTEKLGKRYAASIASNYIPLEG